MLSHLVDAALGFNPGFGAFKASSPPTDLHGQPLAKVLSVYVLKIQHLGSRAAEDTEPGLRKVNLEKPPLQGTQHSGP